MPRNTTPPLVLTLLLAVFAVLGTNAQRPTAAPPTPRPLRPPGNTTSITVSVSRNTPSRSVASLSFSDSPSIHYTSTPSSSQSGPSRSFSVDVTPSKTVTLTPSRSRTLPGSVTRSHVESPTISETFAGAAWLCRNVEFAATFQQISPKLGSPVRVGGIISTTDNVIASSALIVVMNISSCHTFYRAVKPAFTVVINQSTGTSQSDLLSLLLAGNAGASAVTNVGSGLGGLARLAEQNPQLIKFVADTPTSGYLTIGPDPLYGTTSTDVTLLQVLGDAYFIPPLKTNPNVYISVSPAPQATAVPERGAAEGIGFAVGVLSALIGSSQTASIAGRIGTVYTAIDCPVTLSANTETRADQNLLGLQFGEEKKISWVVGGAVYNPLLVIAVAAGSVIVVGLATFLSNGSIEEVMGVFRFPGILVPVIMFVFQGTVFSAGATLFNSRTFQASFLASAALLSLLAFVACVFLATMPQNFDKLALRAGVETAARPLHPAIKHIFGSGVWIDRGTPFVGSFGPLFKEYLPGRQWFLVVELLASLFLGLIEATLPATNITCVVSNAALALVLWGHLILVVGAHPYHTTVSFILTIGISLFNLAAAVAAAAAPLLQSSQTTPIVNGLLLTSACIALLKCLVDVAAAVFRTVQRKELTERYVAWLKDSTRRLATQKKNDRLTRQVDRALADDADDPVKRLEAEADLPGSSDDDAEILIRMAHHAATHDVHEGVDPAVARLVEESERALIARMKRRLPNYDDRGATAIRSSVAAVAEVPPETSAKDKDLFVRRTGMTAVELWEAL